MDPAPQRPIDWDLALIALDGAIVVMDLAEKGSNIPPAKAIFGTVGIILATIKVRLLLFNDNFPIFTHNQDSEVHEHVELGLFCTDICEELDRCLFGRKMDELTKSVCDAMDRLASWVQLAIYISIRSLRSSRLQDHGRDSEEVGQVG